MTKYLLPLLVVSTISIASEVSVYGNSNSNSSYGLSNTEKHIMKNQSNISDLSSKYGEIKSLVDSLNRRLEGLESTHEGDSSKLNSTVKKLDDLTSQFRSSSFVDSDENTSSSNISGDDITSLKASISKLNSLVNKINSEYVSSNELQKNMQQFVTREEFEALKKSVGVKSSSTATATQTTTTASSTVETKVAEPSLATADDRLKYMNQAKEEYKNKNFTAAIPKFEKLVELNYKPAENSYYLGDMWYVRKKYDVAISHFKKSAMLNDKAAYMPSLLLRSAISFENTKDKENARNFYSTLIDLYPNSSEAKDAKNRLSKL
jgi:TolA-binding protein